jgi:predicted RNase H-like HicB family nuclease
MQFTAIIEGDDRRGYSAYVPDLEGVVATGSTEDLTKERIKSGISYHLAKLRAAGEPSPQPRSRAVRP